MNKKSFPYKLIFIIYEFIFDILIVINIKKEY